MDRDRYIGENCGDSTGAVLGPGVRGLCVDKAVDVPVIS